MSTLSSKRWQEVSPYLDEVLSLPEEDRAGWLEAFRTEKRDLAELLQELLREHEAAAQEGFLERESVTPVRESFLTGQVVGSYRLISAIGQGGMGSVWLAERSDGRFERRVAVKFLRCSIAAQGGADRFKREGRILGQLAHPHIAELIDAGVTTSGEPYLVLEHVEGETIDEYCDRHRLDIESRVHLFLDVVSGVAHAHANLVVHRDLKPSNVLVRNDGQVKLLDFGIAKLLAGDGSGAATLTLEAGSALTPQFAAPEQITGRAITTATDVYALGTLLYLLLAGKHPAGDAAGSPAELVRALTEMDPPRASDMVSPAEDNSVVRNRSTSCEKLRRQLRGDLDTILAKALKKDPQDRYPSALAMGDDLRRYLQREPISARPDSFTYRAKKYLLRHKALVVGATAVFLALLAGGITSAWQAVKARRAEAQAKEQSAVAQAVNDFLQHDLLAQASAATQSDPHTKPDPDLKVRTALDRAAERIEGKFAKQPEVEAAIRNTVGQTYTELGLYPEATRQLEQALNLRRRVLGPEHPDTLKSMTILADVFNLEGKSARAEALHSQTLEIRRRVLGPEHPETLQSMNDLTNVYWSQGKYAQAEALDSQILEIRRRVLGPEHPHTLASMNNLASDYADEGKYAEAEALDSQTLETRRRVLGPEHPETLQIMNNLAIVYMNEGKVAQAESIESQTVEIQRRVLGPEHSATLRSMSNLAIAYLYEGKYAQAEALNSQTLETRRRVLGPEHPDTLMSMANLAEDYADEGKYAQAERLLSQVLKIKLRVLGPEHSMTLNALANFAFMYQRQGKYSLAENYASQTLAGRRHALGEEHPDTMISVADLALAYVSQGKFAQSEPLARELVALEQKKQPDNWQRFRAETLLGASLAGEKKYAEGEPQLLEGYQGMLARKERIDTPDRYHLQLAHEWLVQLYKDWGKPEKAAAIAKESD